MLHPRILWSFGLTLGLVLTPGCDSGSGSGSDNDGGTGDEEGDSNDAEGDSGNDENGDSGDDGNDGNDDAGSGDGEGGGENGDSDDAGDGGEGGSLDGIEEACEDDCEAQFALECAPPNSNVLTCKLSCASQTNYLGDFCLAEYEDVVRCRADGGYECVNDYPRSLVTCTSQWVAYQECQVDLGCKRRCDTSVDLGCVADFDTCLTSCIGEKETYPEGCHHYLNSFSHCEGTYGDTCVDGDLATDEICHYSALDIAECIWDESENMCNGWCWGADKLGCGADCSSECAAASQDPTCGAAYIAMIDCALLFGDAACQDGQLVGNDLCDDETATWLACAGN